MDALVPEGMPHWLRDIIAAAIAWAIECGADVGGHNLNAYHAATSGAETELDYYAIRED